MPKDILVFGGTQMLGRDFVEQISSNSAEYSITLANRGITNPELFSDLKRIKIDRDSAESYSVLNTKIFDIVVDFSCYTTDHLTNALKNTKTHKYILISTQSVFDTGLINSNDYNNPYWKYCYDKKKIEDLVYGDKNIVNMILIRPCAVYGDNDYTNRFEKIENEYYWKYSGAKASDSNGCISVKQVTNKIIELLEKTYQEKICSYNIG
jgi:dTDP-4-dehydrorhamnose reductase